MKKIIQTSLVVLALFGAAPVRAQDCGASFYPMKAGTKMTLNHFDAKNKPSGQSLQTIKSSRATANGMEADVESEFVDSKGRGAGKRTYAIACENGVFKLNMQDMMGSAAPAQPQSKDMTLEVTGDNLDLPVKLKAGQVLNGGTMNMKSYMGGMKLMDWDFIIKDRKVESVESVTVPAGTFECYKVTYLMDYKMMGKMRHSKSTVWYAKGAGMVKQETYDDGGKSMGSLVLASLTK